MASAVHKKNKWKWLKKQGREGINGFLTHRKYFLKYSDILISAIQMEIGTFVTIIDSCKGEVSLDLNRLSLNM